VSDLQHPGSRSFEQVAELYERVRPSYPEEAVDWLAEQLRLGASSTVLDLGAGTGKLTAAFVPRVARVIAVEPGPEMLAQLRRAVPQADAVLGPAEAIPLPDASVDAVVCGQSFHWFRTDEARQEIQRVLRPGHGLGMIWNLRDPGDPLQQEITGLLDPFVPNGRATEEGVEAFVRRTFAELTSGVFAFAEPLDPETVAARIASISFVAAAPARKERELLDAVRALAVARGERVPFRYRTEAYVTFSVA
jgi:ubiquinone/menaquinone biosynthesis C-methylase UbiE